MTRPHISWLSPGLAMFLASPCWAQGGPNPYTDLSQYMIAPSGQVVPNDSVVGTQNGTSAGSNSSTVNQVGNNNSASVDLRGSFNLTAQTQIGLGNESNFVAIGNQNNLQNTQIGNGNSANISVNGNGNNISNSQIGTNLTYGLTQVGNGRAVSVTQTGIGK